MSINRSEGSFLGAAIIYRVMYCAQMCYGFQKKIGPWCYKSNTCGTLKNYLLTIGQASNGLKC